MQVHRRGRTTGGKAHNFGQAIDPSIAAAFCLCGLAAPEVVSSCLGTSNSCADEDDATGQLVFDWGMIPMVRPKEPLHRRLILDRRNGRGRLSAFAVEVLWKSGLGACLFGFRKPLCGLRRHYARCGASRLRCWYKFTRAKAAHSHW